MHPENTEINAYYKFNQQTQAWDDIAQTIQSINGATRIQFTLEDGGPYDADGQANGTIQDPGGPAAIGSVTRPANIPTMNQWGMILLISGLGFALMRLTRRKQAFK